MALIKESKGRKKGSGYERLFGNNKLGYLLSRVQSAVIRTGYELEKIILQRAHTIHDLDAWLTQPTTPHGTYLISKKAVKKSSLKTNFEPDLLIFKIDAQTQHSYIVELKDGDSFDTKKAQAERDLLQRFQQEISSKLPYTTSIHVCSFNQTNKKKIMEGFRYKITSDMAMTGRELCQILSLDYQHIVHSRNKDQIMNMDFFIEELLTIHTLKEKIKKKLPNL